MSSPVFGVAGWKNSGKTTLVTRLVREFTSRGLRVSTVKHAHHSFDIDQPETDSFRHRQAGATEVMLVSGHRWALMHELRQEGEPLLEAALARISPCDLILVEGYKHGEHPKIEVRRQGGTRGEPISPGDPFIVAVAADHELAGERLPSFDLNDAVGMTDFITVHLGLHIRNG